MLNLLNIESLATLLALAAGGLVVVWGLVFKAKRDGRKEERDESNAADAQAYVDERKRQDGLDLGVGASDAARIKLLNEIADRGGAGNP